MGGDNCERESLTLVTKLFGVLQCVACERNSMHDSHNSALFWLGFREVLRKFTHCALRAIIMQHCSACYSMQCVNCLDNAELSER